MCVCVCVCVWAMAVLWNVYARDQAEQLEAGAVSEGKDVTS